MNRVKFCEITYTIQHQPIFRNQIRVDGRRRICVNETCKCKYLIRAAYPYNVCFEKMQHARVSERCVLNRDSVRQRKIHQFGYFFPFSGNLFELRLFRPMYSQPMQVSFFVLMRRSLVTRHLWK